MNTNYLYSDIIQLREKINNINGDIREIKKDVYNMKKDIVILTNLINKLNNSKT